MKKNAKATTLITVLKNKDRLRAKNDLKSLKIYNSTEKGLKLFTKQSVIIQYKRFVFKDRTDSIIKILKKPSWK